MNIQLLGISHKTAPLTLRERLVFSETEMISALKGLSSYDGIDEVVIVSTCNRTEIIYCADKALSLLEWLCEHKQVPVATLKDVSYRFEGKAAVQHIMQVACGLDSMVLGEPQVFGQVKESFSHACMQGTVGMHLSRLFRHVFKVAKEVRTTTEIGVCPVSVASMAVKLVESWLSEYALPSERVFSQKKVLVLGAGDTGSLIAKYVLKKAPQQLTVASHHLARAEALAKQLNVNAIALKDTDAVLGDVDVIISATASQLPILTYEKARQLIDARRPVLMVDIAVPRDIEARVSELTNVTLYTIDHLKEVIQSHVDARTHAADEAKAMIAEEISTFMLTLNALNADDVIKSYREHVEAVRGDALKKAKQALKNGGDAEAVMTLLSQTITNKLMHTPCVQLKQSCSEGRRELLSLAAELLGFEHVERVTEK